MAIKPDEFIPTRPSLLERLKDLDDHASWQDFYNTYRRLIFATAIKAGLRESEAEDVVQETVMTVAKTMPEFQYDPGVCKFKTWLMRLTYFRISDHLRKHRPSDPLHDYQSEDSTGTSALEKLPNSESPALEAIWDEEWKADLLEKALQRVKAKVNAEQYQIFDFYVIRKCSVLKVSKDLGVNVGRVYLTKHRIAKLIREEMELIEQELLKPRWPIGKK